MNKLIVLGLIPVLMLTVPNTLFASELSEEEKESGFYRENGSVISNTKERPAINPDFNPDEDCNIAYELTIAFFLERISSYRTATNV